MRAAYLTLGVLMGLLASSMAGLRTVDTLNHAIERDLHVATLTGYYEGMQRGRDLTAFIYGGLLYECQTELSRMTKGRK